MRIAAGIILIIAAIINVIAGAGYVLGGVSPLGQRRRLPTVLDESAERFDTVYVSAGKRGMDVELAPGDLQSLLGARLGDFLVGLRLVDLQLRADVLAHVDVGDVG